MANSYSTARTALEKVLGRAFTEYQWELLVSQGYEAAILSRQRTPEEVAQELSELVAVLGGAGDKGERSTRTPEPRNWEEMEKVILARALVTGGPGRRRAPAGAPAGATAAPQAATQAAPQAGAPGRAPASASAAAFGSGGGGPAGGRGGGGLGRRGGPPADEHVDLDDWTPRRRWPNWWLWAALTVIVVATAVVLLLVFTSGGDTPSTTTVAEVTTTTAPVTTTSSSTTSTTSTSTTTTLAPTTTTADPSPTYTAQLSGADAIPPIESDASGTFAITIAEDGLSADFVLAVTDLADLTIVRARTAPAGQTGDEVFTVYPGPTIAGPLNGSVVEGTITADDLLGPLAGQTIADLVNLIKAGEVYINVGTSANPGGELRGQL